MLEFEFSYMMNKNKVSLDDKTLYARIGPIIKKEIGLDSIQHFYIKEYKDYKELIIRYSKLNGKVANQKLLFAYGETGANNLADALAARFPEKDLRGADPKEAMKLMKASNSQKMGFIIALIVMFLVVTGIFVPTLMHFFDNGHQDVNVKNIVDGEKLKTRNLTISGMVLNAGMEEETTTTKSGSSSTTEKNYFPLVSEEWQDGQPVHVLLQATGYMTQDDVDYFVYETGEFNGVVRNVWWEGIDDEQIKFFADEYGITFDNNAILFEITNEKPDAIMFYVYLGVLGILLIIFIIIGIKQRK